MKLKNKSRHTSVLIVAIILIIGGYGLTLVLMELTVISPYLFWSAIGLFSFLTIPVFMRVAGQLDFSDKTWVKAIACFIAECGIFAALFLSVNYFCSDREKAEKRSFEVERTYSEKKYRSRRIGRNRYTRGEEYTMYYADIKVTDVLTKTISIDINKFRRLHPGDSLQLRVTNGFFGFDVIRR